jgi:hypothetical protein
MRTKSLALVALFLLACPGDADDGDTAADSGSGGVMCDPGIIQDCACPDGSQSMQTCNAEGTGFSACECGGTEGATSAGSTSSSTSGGTTTSAGSTADTGEGSSGGGSDSGGQDSSSDGGIECMGSHPLVEGDLRYCERGDCYCGDLQARPPVDVCYAMDIAEACCPEGIELVCY